MSNIEPTEEQKQAARDLYNNLLIDFNMGADIRPPEALARLLAEREAKLREEVARLEALCTEEARLIVERDTLRARVAELEGQVSESTRLRMTETLHGMGVEAMYQEREAQHLARIAELEAKAANLDARLWDRCEDLARVGLERVHADAVHSKREAQHLADIKVATSLLGELLEQYREFGGIRDATHAKAKTEYARLAHYDDAKADAPAVDWQAWANGSCPEPGCSLANPHEQGAACVKPTDAEGGEG